jgi:succinoglycan biosynthesis protein ExoA
MRGVSLVMPFLNEAAYLPTVLASLAAQTVEPSRLRLIAVDDGSSDAGAALVRSWLAGRPLRGDVLVSGARSIARALNLALREAGEDDVIVRLDAHTVYEPDYLATILQAFEDLPGDVWCVGGSCVPAEASSFGEKLHAALFASRMGLGPSDYQHARNVREVASVYLGAWRPGVLQRVGGFDTGWRANEDAELAERIREAGGRVMWIPARSRYLVTRGARASIARWSRYGFWRAQTLKRHPRALRARHLAPPLALLGAAGLAASPARFALAPLFAGYATAVWATRPAGQEAAVTAASTVYFPLVQAGFAGGLLAGLFSGTGRNRLPAATGRAAASP